MPVKILHTADWHLGKVLHKYSLEQDHQLFLEWLYRRIVEQEIDLLLVSGDIFDTSLPSSATLALYYNFLRKLVGLKCKVVVTGGNHDSPGVLNAARHILEYLDIRVVGHTPDMAGDNLLAYPEFNLYVAAVPYLREADLRKSVSGQSMADRAELIREGIARNYQALVDLHKSYNSSSLLIGMGHLYVNGAETSDSERDVHVVGNLAAFSTQHFPEGFAYMALGHIHKPQKLTEYIRYSGSPIPLSFSERADQKYVIELTLNEGVIESVMNVPVPEWRELRSFSGDLDQVWSDLDAYRPATLLEPLVEINVTEPVFDPAKSMRFELLLKEFEKASFHIIKPRLTFENRMDDAAALFVSGTAIEDLAPREVFRKKIDADHLDEETIHLLQEAFEELLAELHDTH